jgi:hypothetical protein
MTGDTDTPSLPVSTFRVGEAVYGCLRRRSAKRRRAATTSGDRAGLNPLQLQALFLAGLPRMADQRRTAGNLCRNVAIYFSPADKAALF